MQQRSVYEHIAELTAILGEKPLDKSPLIIYNLNINKGDDEEGAGQVDPESRRLVKAGENARMPVASEPEAPKVPLQSTMRHQ